VMFASVDVLYFSEAFFGWDGIGRVIWMYQQTGQYCILHTGMTRNTIAVSSNHNN
jgi:hypothetical protein